MAKGWSWLLLATLAIAGAFMVNVVREEDRKPGPAAQLNSNWDRMHAFSPRERLEPGSVKEVSEIVSRARAEGKKVKVVGAGHSWNDIAVPSDVLLSLDRMQRVLDVDLAEKQVTVEAGIRLFRLSETLATLGLALPNMPSVDEQSIAGALATATHGTGAKLGIVATSVVWLQIVDGTGRVMELSESQNPDVFQAARVALGALGVVTAVRLQLVPAFHVHAVAAPMSEDEVQQRFDEIADRSAYVKYWWMPHSGSVLVFQMNVTESPLREDVPRWTLELAAWANHAVQWLTSHMRFLTPAANRALAALTFMRHERVARSDQAFVIPFIVKRHGESEFAVPREQGAEVFRQLRQWAADNDVFLNHIVEIRFVAADDIWLSPDYQQASTHFSFLLPHSRGAGDVAHHFKQFEERFFLPRQARPHWAKTFFATAAQLEAMYPRWRSFLAVRTQLDPDGVFSNAYLDRVLGPTAELGGHRA